MINWSYLKEQFTSPTPSLFWQLVKYCFSGGIAFVVDFTLLWVGTSCLGLHYLWAAGIGYTVGLAITYLLSISWIFDEHRLPSRAIEFVLFALIGALGLGLTELCMKVFTDLLLGLNSYPGFHEYAYLCSKVLTTIIVSLFNFILKKTILFTSKKS